jgi:hypothetical protein
MKLPQRDLVLACPLLDPAFQFIVTSLQGVARITQGRIGRRPFRNVAPTISRVLMDQTCFGRSGGFARISLPLF